MDLHRKLSESSDDSNASDNSIELPPSFNCDEKKTEEIIQRNRESFDELKRSTEELKSEYDRNHPTLISKIKELKDITDEIESVHKNSRVGSSVGSSIGVVGGVTALVGLALAPFTLGASLALTAVGAVAGAAGGVTGAASNLTDMFKQKNLKQTIVKIISDFEERIKPMTEHRSTISYIAADIQRMNEILSKVEFQTSARGLDDLCKIVKVANVALIGKLCAEAAEEICVCEGCQCYMWACTGSYSYAYNCRKCPIYLYVSSRRWRSHSSVSWSVQLLLMLLLLFKIQQSSMK